MIEEETGPVDNEAGPTELGVKATTAELSTVMASVANVKTAADNRFRLGRFINAEQLLWRLILAAESRSRTRRDLFLLLVSNIVVSSARSALCRVCMTILLASIVQSSDVVKIIKVGAVS
mmetsp:Transcript_15237/g.38374  ORF Transcript_15237/g.38374 Transcript_15237/m.38374 type:complete len:120 (+) Transcript_15237:740-1099(+)